MRAALRLLSRTRSKAKVLISWSIRAKKPGDYKFHGTAPTDEQLKKALPEIEARIGSADLESLTTFLKRRGHLGICAHPGR